MKIISLNIWGGRMEKDLLSFIASHKNVDVFCFQEVFNAADSSCRLLGDYDVADIFSKISDILPDRVGFFSPQFEDCYGLAMFYKKNLSVQESSDIMLTDFPMTEVNRNLQSIIVSNKGKGVNILNFHGLWNGKGKSDSSDRVAQSNSIIDFLKDKKYPVVLSGDYNLNPDTESIALLESLPLRNLIIENNISNTRTSFYKNENRFADYILVDPSIEVGEFKVLPDEVSDHAPLYLEI